MKHAIVVVILEVVTAVALGAAVVVALSASGAFAFGIE
jgi:hypothetical protein